MAKIDSMSYQIQTVPTKPFHDQQPGTAGLRKRVKVFSQQGYLENFVQAIFDTNPGLGGGTLILGGDGRFFNREAIRVVLRMAAANGVVQTIVGRAGLLSTPAASHLIRLHKATGGFILTASHNPGGPNGDFGIKFNTATGGQASEQLTEAIFHHTRKIRKYYILDTSSPSIDTIGTYNLGPMQVRVIDPVTDYARLMADIFDFDTISELLRDNNFKLLFDAMHGVTGPYATEILVHQLGAPVQSVMHADPLPDFGGRPPDPNPQDNTEFFHLLNRSPEPAFGGASDGDGDRNMIAYPGGIVSPGDSLAVILANAGKIPGYRRAITGVARSMPTSQAVDRVATALGIPCYETPTGWRFFCNLLESGRISFCGEESFGTGSSHVREKDGLWALLCWLNIMADTKLSVRELLDRHWRKYGRDYFQRQDYFIADPQAATALMSALTESLSKITGQSVGNRRIVSADSFSYKDPVDGSISHNQGIRIFLEDDSRIVYRLSGTDTKGATLRIYLAKYEPRPSDFHLPIKDSLGKLSAIAGEIAGVEAYTGLTGPQVTI